MSVRPSIIIYLNTIDSFLFHFLVMRRQSELPMWQMWALVDHPKPSMRRATPPAKYAGQVVPLVGNAASHAQQTHGNCVSARAVPRISSAVTPARVTADLTQRCMVLEEQLRRARYETESVRQDAKELLAENERLTAENLHLQRMLRSPSAPTARERAPLVPATLGEAVLWHASRGD